MKTKLFLGLTLAMMIFAGNIFAAPKPKITMEQAREIALKRVGGEIEESDTVKKHNKSYYSFTVRKTNGVTTQVLVSEKGKIEQIKNEKPVKGK